MILTDLSAYLVSQTVGTLGVDIFLGKLPSLPNRATSIIQSGGLPPLEDFSNLIERPRIQLLIRDSTYATSRMWAEQIYQTMMRIQNISLSSTWYMKCEADSAPILLERDEHGRPIFVINFELWKEF